METVVLLLFHQTKNIHSIGRRRRQQAPVYTRSVFFFQLRSGL